MPAETSPTARALLALECIQSRPGVTAGGLAAALGVTERAARRYVAILREAGVPVESVRGPYGGYRLGRRHRPPPLVFTADEALGLVMAVLDGHHAADDPTAHVGSALGKIVRSLPERLSAQVEAVRRTTTAAPDRAAVRPDPGTTAALVEACAARRAVRIGYRSAAGSSGRELDVDPWALVVRHGRWYLLCWSHGAGARRAYRVDRIGHVVLLDAAVVPPEDLDPVRDLEVHLSVGWEFEVEVVVDAPAEVVPRWLPPAMGRVEAVDRDRARVLGSTSNPVWYAEQLVVLPVPYRIVRCPELREAARELGRRLAAAGEESGDRPGGGRPVADAT
ncbi:WYL domain-containing protein [Blastococcus saxobsidens]|uniref:WYL domain-containing protein n=1 Tax=Blastococcus saxobsidens TaxID=138336 RepID=A0A6L9W252_9ACTN|nr:WYL domain-containing protein [Blastococcus saxobsidens]NEK85819.1 WYL domain-containing protein [Blastococcus saxobsidens]